MARKKAPGPIVPLGAYARLGYECIRCKDVFHTDGGPEIFCAPCRAFIEVATQRQGKADP